MRLIDKTLAIKLRREGLSYSEIASHFDSLPKSTLSGWLKCINLTNVQQKRILEKTLNAGERGRQIGAWTNKEKARIRIEKIQVDAEVEYAKLRKNPFFIAGLALYWAEGSKKSRFFQFINSDPKMIKFMMDWLAFLKISNDSIKIRLYIHDLYKTENCENFWLKLCKLKSSNLSKTIYKPSTHSVKKNPDYKGCCRIEISKSEIFWKIEKWISLLAEEVMPSW